MSEEPNTGHPLSPAQSGIWYAQQLDPASPIYNCGDYVEIAGPVDPARFADAARRTVAEVDALRLRCTVVDGEPRQFSTTDPAEPPSFLDVRAEADPLGAARAWMSRDMATPVDLCAGPLFTQALFAVADETYLWYLRVHHIALDGYGFALIHRRVAQLYTALATGEPAGESPFAPLRLLFDEDAAYRDSERFAADRRFWTDRLAGLPEVAGLTPATARTSRSFLRHGTRLPAAQAAALDTVGRPAKAGRAEFMFAAAALYLHRMTGAGDVVLGVPSMGRMGSVALRVPSTVVNVLPLRLTLRPSDTLAELLAQVTRELRAIRRHQRYRYEELRRDLALSGAAQRMFGMTVNVKPFGSDLRFGAHPGTVHNLSAGPVEDLEIVVYEPCEGDLRIDIDANPALYGAEEPAEHGRRLIGLLGELAAPGALDRRIGDVEIRAPAERARMAAWNATDHPVPAQYLHEAFEAQVRRSPTATAVVFEGTRLDYAGLDTAVNRLAHRLVSAGAGPGHIVAIAVPRGVELIVGLLATLKAGAAYLPLDPDYPADRLAFMLRDAAPSCLLATTATAHAVPADPDVARIVLDEPETAAAIARGPDHPPDDRTAVDHQRPAYVIYTSGSTGTPKGVVVPHAGIVNRLRWMQDRYRLRPGDRVLQKTPTGFDVSVWELFWPLLEGAALVLARPEGHRDPAYLAEVIRAERIDTVHFVPSMLRVFLAEPAAAGCGAVLRRVICSGEALSGATRDAFYAVFGPETGARLHNLYGPTEASVDVTAWECAPDDGDDQVPIGRPVWNTRTYVLDAGLRPVPVGVTGELFIAGVQLARGYLNRPDLTAERFVPDPFGTPGDRMYRTGDLVRWRADGALEFHGRADQQVKIRGMRVEPGEIEAALDRHPGVAEAAVLARADRPADPRLVGYLVPANGHPPDPAELRRHLAGTLPEHMIPGAFVRLDALPMTPNGKLDRAALPAPQERTERTRPPRDRREELLCELFARALGVPRVGVDDGFFDLGGHSLLAAQLAGRIRTELGAEVTIATLFAAPTVAALSERLDSAQEGGELDVVLPLRATGDRPALFCVHPAGGLSWVYSGLLGHLPADQPVYGLQARGLDGRGALPGTLAEMAEDYADRIRAVRPTGPYHLLGWSVGGVVAHEIAVRLRRRGAEVGSLTLLDAYPSDQWRDLEPPDEAGALAALLYMGGHDLDVLGGRPPSRGLVIDTLRRHGSPLADLGERTLSAIVDVVVNNTRLMREHTHDRFDGDVQFCTATAPREQTWLTREAWRPYVLGEIHNQDVGCTHPNMMRPGPLAHIGRRVAARLAAGAGLAPIIRPGG